MPICAHVASVSAKTMATQITNYGVVRRRAVEDAAGLGFAAPRLSALGLASCAATLAVVVDSITRNSLADSGDAEREGHAVAAE
jgi:hypothetical protein